MSRANKLAMNANHACHVSVSLNQGWKMCGSVTASSSVSLRCRVDLMRSIIRSITMPLRLDCGFGFLSGLEDTEHVEATIALRHACLIATVLGRPDVGHST